MEVMPLLRRLHLEPFVVAILLAVLVAAILPATGTAADVLDVVTTIGIAVLFFLYGARLEPRETIEGLKHWRLHGVVFAFTFVVFPVLGLILRLALTPVLGDQVANGILYLCLVPSTIQSSITFVSIARGNVAAAVVSASISNLLGVLLTPLLVLALMSTDGSVHVTGDSILSLVLQLLLPFVLGQLLRRWVLPIMSRIPRLSLFDRTTIVLIVYSAFSEGMAEGIWHSVAPWQVVVLIGVCAGLLAVVLWLTGRTATLLHFSRADERVIQFCGSKKSLATGLPMAAVLFAGQPVGLLVLPLMLFHQIQLIVCSAMASRYARELEEGSGGTAGGENDDEPASV